MIRCASTPGCKWVTAVWPAPGAWATGWAVAMGRTPHPFTAPEPTSAEAAAADVAGNKDRPGSPGVVGFLASAWKPTTGGARWLSLLRLVEAPAWAAVFHSLL